MSGALSTTETLADLVAQLGGVPLDRILMHPAPGTATVDDLTRLLDGEPKLLCELVDGVVVEKAMGHLESRLAARLIFSLSAYLENNDIGIVAGADGPHRLGAKLVRLPDVAFISYDRIPKNSSATTAVPTWIPNLAVEIVSADNTLEEMARKRRDYFVAGVDQVWIVTPATRSVAVYSDADTFVMVSDADFLDGGAVLPGFRLSVHDWFERALKVQP